MGMSEGEALGAVLGSCVGSWVGRLVGKGSQRSQRPLSIGLVICIYDSVSKVREPDHEERLGDRVAKFSLRVAWVGEDRAGGSLLIKG